MTTAASKLLLKRAWKALGETASGQAAHQAACDPVGIYFQFLRTALVSGKAHVAALDGGVPENPGAWGWREEASADRLQRRPMGDLIGWVDGEELYLEPGAAYLLAKRMARDAGDSLPLGKTTLTKRLHERGMLSSVEKEHGTLMVRKSVGGGRPYVLHMHASMLVSTGVAQPAQAGQGDTHPDVAQGLDWGDVWADEGWLPGQPDQKASPDDPTGQVIVGEGGQSGQGGQVPGGGEPQDPREHPAEDLRNSEPVPSPAADISTGMVSQEGHGVPVEPQVLASFMEGDPEELYQRGAFQERLTALLKGTGPEATVRNFVMTQTEGLFGLDRDVREQAVKVLKGYGVLVRLQDEPEEEQAA